MALLRGAALGSIVRDNSDLRNEGLGSHGYNSILMRVLGGTALRCSAGKDSEG